MNWLKSFLTIVGLGTVLLVGSCIVVVGGNNAQNTTSRVKKPITELKQLVYEYFGGATTGSFGAHAKVDYMSDGTVQLRIGKVEPYDMKVSVTFDPVGEDATSVSATINADNLAAAQQPKVEGSKLNNCLRDDFEVFLNNVRDNRDGGKLDLDDVIARSRQSSNGLPCYRPPVPIADH